MYNRNVSFICTRNPRHGTDTSRDSFPNGGGPIPVGVTGNDVVTFGTSTRQVFSSVTGEYVDFPRNGTTVIYTNVTCMYCSSYELRSYVLTICAIVGVSSIVPIPVTFSGQVYLDFTADCRIEAVRAYAEIPTYIAGKPVTIYELLPIPTLPI
jgi:hypothetical protein